jgi:hypothetical protein
MTVLSSHAHVRKHLMQSIQDMSVTRVETSRVKKVEMTCVSSKDFTRFLNLIEDAFTHAYVTIVYEHGYSIVKINKDAKYTTTFNAYVSTDIEPVFGTVRRSSTYASCLEYIKRLVIYPRSKSFAKCVADTNVVLYDRFRDAPVCHVSHENLLENLLEVAWHPSRLKNCLDERELDNIRQRWSGVL